MSGLLPAGPHAEAKSRPGNRYAGASCCAALRAIGTNEQCFTLFQKMYDIYDASTVISRISDAHYCFESLAKCSAEFRFVNGPLLYCHEGRDGVPRHAPAAVLRHGIMLVVALIGNAVFRMDSCSELQSKADSGNSFRR